MNKICKIQLLIPLHRIFADDLLDDAFLGFCNFFTLYHDSRIS